MTRPLRSLAEHSAERRAERLERAEVAVIGSARALSEPSAAVSRIVFAHQIARLGASDPFPLGATPARAPPTIERFGQPRASRALRLLPARLEPLVRVGV